MTLTPFKLLQLSVDAGKLFLEVCDDLMQDLALSLEVYLFADHQPHAPLSRQIDIDPPSRAVSIRVGPAHAHGVFPLFEGFLDAIDYPIDFFLLLLIAPGNSQGNGHFSSLHQANEENDGRGYDVEAP